MDAIKTRIEELSTAINDIEASESQIEQELRELKDSKAAMRAEIYLLKQGAASLPLFTIVSSKPAKQSPTPILRVATP